VDLNETIRALAYNYGFIQVLKNSDAINIFTLNDIIFVKSGECLMQYSSPINDHDSVLSQRDSLCKTIILNEFYSSHLFTLPESIWWNCSDLHAPYTVLADTSVLILAFIQKPVFYFS